MRSLRTPCLLAIALLFSVVSRADALVLAMNSSFSVGSLGIHTATGITYDSANNALWLCDSGSADRIVRVPLAGGSITTTYNAPSSAIEGMCVNWSGNFALVDPVTDKLYTVLKSNGNLASTLGLLTGGLSGPAGITWDSSNNSRWAAGYESKRVFQLDSTNTIVASFSTGATIPEGIAYNSSSDKLFLVDAVADKLWEVNKTGTAGTSYDLVTRGIFNATGVTRRASDGHIFISDNSATHKVFELDSSYNVVTSFTLNANNNAPTDIAYHSGTDKLYVIDNADSDSIFIYSTAGAYIDKFPLGKGYSEGICVIGNGNLYVLDWRGFVDELQTDWTYIGQQYIQQVRPTNAVDITIDATYYYIPDYVQKKIYKITQAGGYSSSFSTTGFGCNQPEGIYYDSASTHLFITDSSSDRLYETTTAGALVASYDLSAFGINYPTGITKKTASGEFFIIDIEDDVVYNMSLIEGGFAQLGEETFGGGTLFGFNTLGAGPVEIVDIGGNYVAEITEGITPGDIFPQESVFEALMLLDDEIPYVPDRSVRMYRGVIVPSQMPRLSFAYLLGEFDEGNYFAVLYDGVELARFDSGDRRDEFATVTIDMAPYAGTQGRLEFFLAGTGIDDIPDKVYIDDISLTGVPEPSSALMAGGLAALLLRRSFQRKRFA